MTRWVDEASIQASAKATGVFIDTRFANDANGGDDSGDESRGVLLLLLVLVKACMVEAGRDIKPSWRVGSASPSSLCS